VLVRNNSTETANPISQQLAHQNGLWSEFAYPEGSEIFGEAEPADYVYRVREGAVRTHKMLSDGRRQIRAFHLPGDVFGAENDEVHRFTAEAIVDTTVWVAKRRSLFAGLARGDIPTAKHVRDLIAASLEHVENHLLLLGRQNSLERVAAFLAEMDRRPGCAAAHHQNHIEQPGRQVGLDYGPATEMLLDLGSRPDLCSPNSLNLLLNSVAACDSGQVDIRFDDLRKRRAKFWVIFPFSP
jgi:Cyclic nucleotide-binding domain